MSARAYVAVDLGAGSGRVVLGRFTDEALELETVHRFPQPTAHVDGHDRWRLEQILTEIEDGLVQVAQRIRNRPAEWRSIGVDTWGVDFGLLDARGELLADPVCYRDARTTDLVETLCELLPREELYARAGTQFQPFNTLVQLLAMTRSADWPATASRLLMMPDLVHHHLSGYAAGEQTNASTTQMFDARTREWIPKFLRAVGVPPEILPEIHPPGTELGCMRADLCERLGLPKVRIVCPATHDTASAVAGTPLEKDWAYISSGTWSLVGLERREPVLTPQAREGGFTNEAGVGETTRFLANCMGLWILESCRETWRERAELLPYDLLLERVAKAAPIAPDIDVDDPRFLNPANMIAEIRSHLSERGIDPPEDQVRLSRIILDSLARQYAAILARLTEVTASSPRGIHIVGGGSRNDYLNQAAANLTGLPVRAGPTEATAIGNLTVQAIQDGLFPNLTAAREFLSRVLPVREFEPA